MAHEMETKIEAPEEELMDEGLRKMVRFKDLTAQSPVAAEKANVAERKLPQAAAVVEEEQAAAAEWESVQGQTEKKLFPDKLVSCGKWALAFGGINVVLFWWLQAGLLASEAAWPSMVVCAALGGLTVGWNAK